MSTAERNPMYLCLAIQFYGGDGFAKSLARFGKRLWIIRTMTAPIRFRLLKLIHFCRQFVDPSGFDMVPITFKLYDQTVTYYGPNDKCYGEWIWVTERRFQVPVTDFRFQPKRAAYTKIMSAYLRSLQIPEHEHPKIIKHVCEVLDLADPGLPLVVWIRRLIIHCPNSVESYIEGLEKVRFDSLEGNTPCAICTEDLDHFRGGIDKDEQQTIIRLPCLHLYHRDCIVPWLKRRRVCPLCRHSMPLPQATKTKSSTRSSALPHWPMLIMSFNRTCSLVFYHLTTHEGISLGIRRVIWFRDYMNMFFSDALRYLFPSFFPSQHPPSTFAVPSTFNATVIFNAPLTFNTPVTFNAPLTISTPVTFNAPVTFKAPVTFNASVTFNAPVTSNAPVTLNAHVTFDAPVTFNVPGPRNDNESPSVDSAHGVDESRVVSAPRVDEFPVQSVPRVDEYPSADSAHIVDESPSADSAHIVDEASGVPFVSTLHASTASD